MKKTITIAMVLVLALGVLWTIKNVTDSSQCALEDEKVCFNEELNQYMIEDDATISIQVSQQQIKEDLLVLWQSRYPKYKDALDIQVNDKTITGELIENLNVDIFLVDQHAAIGGAASLYNLEIELEESLINHELNVNSTKYLPTFINGRFMLVDTQSMDDNNLDISITQTFESIIGNEELLHENYEVIFPMMFDIDLMYPFLSAYGWEPFDSLEIEDSHLESQSFLDGLRFIEELGKTVWDQKNVTNNPQEFVYEYDTILLEERSPMSVAMAYVDVGLIESNQQRSYQIQAFPTINDQSLTQLVTTQGWVMHQEVLYPSLGHEVLRFLYSDETIQIIANQQDLIPIYRETYNQLDERLISKSLALKDSRTKPIVVLRNHPDKLLWDVFDDIDLIDVVGKVFQQQLSPEVAQQQLLEKLNEWMREYK